MTTPFPRIRWGQDPSKVFATFELSAHDPHRIAPPPKAEKSQKNDDNRREDCYAPPPATPEPPALTEKDVEVNFSSNSVSVKTSLCPLEFSLFDEVDTQGCTWRLLAPCTVKLTMKKKVRGSSKPQIWRHLLSPNAPSNHRASVQIDWEKWHVDDGSEDDEEFCVGEETEGHAPAPYCSAVRAGSDPCKSGDEFSSAGRGEIPVPISEADKAPIPSDVVPPLVSPESPASKAAESTKDSESTVDTSTENGLNEGRIADAATFFTMSEHMTPAKRMLTLVRLWNSSDADTRNKFLDMFTSEEFFNAMISGNEDTESKEKEKEELRTLMRGVKGCLGQMSLDASAYEAEGIQAIEVWANELQKLPTAGQKAQVVCHLIGRLSREEQMIVLGTLR